MKKIIIILLVLITISIINNSSNDNSNNIINNKNINTEVRGVFISYIELNDYLKGNSYERIYL